MESKDKPIYTIGIWTTKPGNEAAFISVWADFAQWMSKHTSGAGKGYLLQDAQNPSKFVSMGGWDDTGSIQTWRDSEEFKTFAGKAMMLCQHFEPNMMNVVASSD